MSVGKRTLLARAALMAAATVGMLAPAAAPAQYRAGYRARVYDMPPPIYYGRRYYGPPPGYRADRRDYRGRPGYRCDRGAGGTIIGAIASGLLGNAVAGRHDRSAGTVVGAGAGALAGRAIDRDC